MLCVNDAFLKSNRALWETSFWFTYFSITNNRRYCNCLNCAVFHVAVLKKVSLVEVGNPGPES